MEFERDDEMLLVQLWSTILLVDWNEPSFTLFEIFFGMALRRRIIPFVRYFIHFIFTFLRPINCNSILKLYHQWGDVYFYPHTTIIQNYGCLGRSFVLPRYAPRRIIFLEVMRQIGILQDTYFPTKDDKGTFFPGLTNFHQFTMIKVGQKDIVKLLRPYSMEVSSNKLNNIEGFYQMMMHMIRMTQKGWHEFDFQENIIDNDDDIEPQKRNKIYWNDFKYLLNEMHKVDPNYDPLPNAKTWAQRLRIILGNFSGVYDIMNEKLGRVKSSKVTFVEDVEGLDLLLKSPNLITQQGKE